MGFFLHVQFFPSEYDIAEKKVTQNKLNSITHSTDLGDFLLQATLAEKEFIAEKQNVVVLDAQSYTSTFLSLLNNLWLDS